MLIIGCDYHPSVQQIAWADTETGECGERRLTHCAEAEQFYRELKLQGTSVRVGIEATGHSRWFERLMAELGFELWIGHAAQIRAMQVRKQKNDRRDAEHLLKLMLKDEFPRLTVPSPGEPRCPAVGLASSSHGPDADQGDEPTAGDRDEPRGATQAWAMESAGASAAGIAHAVAVDQPASPRTARSTRSSRSQHRRADEGGGTRRSAAAGGETFADASRRGTNHGTGLRPGAGNTGSLRMWQAGGQLSGVDSVRGLQRRYHWRLGHISKQGSSLLRFLLVEAAQAAARCHPDWRRRYIHLAMRRHRSIAKVAMGRRLAIRLYWMWRNGCEYSQSLEFGSYAGQLGTGHGVK